MKLQRMAELLYEECDGMPGRQSYQQYVGRVLCELVLNVEPEVLIDLARKSGGNISGEYVANCASGLRKLRTALARES